jgi:hypothetical protein
MPLSDVAGLETHERTSLCVALRRALKTARAHGTSTTEVGTETLADSIYLLSDGAGYDEKAVEVSSPKRIKINEKKKRKKKAKTQLDCVWEENDIK